MTEFLSTILRRGWVAKFKTPIVAGLGAAFIAAGCSADVSRFSGPGFNLNADDDKPLLPPASVASSRGNRNSNPYPGVDYSRSTPAPVQTGALSEPTSRSYGSPTERPSPSYSTRQYSAGQPGKTARRPSDYRFQPSSKRTASFERPSQAGSVISVESGDTLYGLSRKHGVSVAELMAANDLNDSKLQIGQKLTIPAHEGARPSRSYASRKTRRPPLPRESVAQAQGVAAPATWGGSYTVRSGDSLYKIARQYGVRTSELQRYNSITDARRVMPGTVLKVPGGTVAPGGSVSSAVAQAPRNGLQRPSLMTAGKEYAALTDGSRRSDARSGPATKGVRTVTIAPPRYSNVKVKPSAPESSGNLLWPVRGRVIAGFGKRPDGTHNDGVNFAVPKGTDVRAADEGVVAYAGSELRSYGNLILLRHDNGWVTAYAHNEKLLVKRGDKVKRGQVIAKSGSSGQVGEPQMHFELRQTSKKPVDPIPYLEKL